MCTEHLILELGSGVFGNAGNVIELSSSLPTSFSPKLTPQSMKSVLKIDWRVPPRKPKAVYKRIVVAANVNF
jgi:hypothetical protein